MASSQSQILIVDDLPDWRTTLRGLLEDEGYLVQVASSSSTALELLEKQDFDLAVLDVRLDDTDEDNVEGLDLANALKSLQPDIKVIIVTGYGTQSILDRAMGGGADKERKRLAAKYIPKKETDTLVEKVKEVLG